MEPTKSQFTPGPSHDAHLRPGLAGAPRPGALWDLRNFALFLGFGAFSGVSAFVAVLVGYLLLARVNRWHIPPRTDQGNVYFSLAIQGLFYVLLLGAIYLLVVTYHRLPFWASVGWRKLRAGALALYFLGGFPLVIAVELAPRLLPDREDFPLERMLSSVGTSYAFALFAVFVAPFMEELIFRGILFSFIERYSGLKSAVVLTAALFGALHLSEYWQAWNHALLIFVVGLVFSLARAVSGSMAASFSMHLAYNLVQMLQFFHATHALRRFAG